MGWFLHGCCAGRSPAASQGPHLDVPGQSCVSVGSRMEGPGVTLRACGMLTQGAAARCGYLPLPHSRGSYRWACFPPSCPPTAQVKASWALVGAELTGGLWVAWEVERVPGPLEPEAPLGRP